MRGDSRERLDPARGTIGCPAAQLPLALPMLCGVDRSPPEPRGMSEWTARRSRVAIGTPLRFPAPRLFSKTANLVDSKIAIH